MRRMMLAALVLSASLPLQAQSAGAKNPQKAPIFHDQAVSSASWPGGLAAFADRPYRVYSGSGLVYEVDPDGPRLYVDGLRFGFAVDAEVRLLSGFGAPTLLKPGMGVVFYFRKHEREEPATTAGEIIAVIEVPADTIELE